MGCLWSVLAGFGFVVSVLVLIAFALVEPVITLVLIVGFVLAVRWLARAVSGAAGRGDR